MKNKLNKEFILQVSIILMCLIILSFRFSTVSAHAEIPCNNEPPLIDPLNPLREAWAQGTITAPKQISVEIFHTPNSTDQDRISDGIMSWNVHRVANCSNVFFNRATPANRPFNANEQLPDNTIWVIRPKGRGSQWAPDYRVSNGSIVNVRAGRMGSLPGNNGFAEYSSNRKFDGMQ